MFVPGKYNPIFVFFQNIKIKIILAVVMPIEGGNRSEKDDFKFFFALHSIALAKDVAANSRSLKFMKKEKRSACGLTDQPIGWISASRL